MAGRKKLTEEQILALPPAEQALLKLREIRASRTLAEKKGVFTCIPQLHRLELQVLASAQTTDNMGTASMDDLVDAVVSAIPTLTPSACARLEQAIAARPPHLRLASGD